MLNAAISSLPYDGQVAIDYPLFLTPDGPSESNPVIQALGLRDKVNQHTNGATLVNFYLPLDSALGKWTANNAVFKPDGGKGYSYSVGIGVYRESFDTSGSHRYYLTSPSGLYEAMGYCVQSRTVAAGANGLVNGCIASKVNMQDEFQFADTHSAEWDLPIQLTYTFWLRVADAFNLGVFVQ